MASEWPIPWEPVEGDRDGAFAWMQYALFRVAVGAGSRLPLGGRRALSNVLGRAARLLDRRHSNAARAYITQALGPAIDERRREQLVLGAWRHLIELALEDARLNATVLGPGLRSHFELELCDDARRLLDERRGFVLITAHIGQWEALPILVSDIAARPGIAISRPPRNRPLSRFAQRTREARGYRLIHRHGALDGLRRVVAAGGWVGVMLDQRARGKPLVAPFFGRPANCERSIPVLMKRLAIPAMIAACYRTARPFHYRVVSSRVLGPEETSRLTPAEIATEINRELECRIRAAPEQYFWLHDRYRKAPPSDASDAEL